MGNFIQCIHNHQDYILTNGKKEGLLQSPWHIILPFDKYHRMQHSDEFIYTQMVNRLIMEFMKKLFCHWRIWGNYFLIFVRNQSISSHVWQSWYFCCLLVHLLHVWIIFNCHVNYIPDLWLTNMYCVHTWATHNSRKCISCIVLSTNNLVIITQKFRDPFLLIWCNNSLF